MPDLIRHPSRRDVIVEWPSFKPEGRSAYRKRKWIAEPPNGWIKNVLGFRQFSMRGLHRVQAEFKLVSLALHLRRMCALQEG